MEAVYQSKSVLYFVYQKVTNVYEAVTAIFNGIKEPDALLAPSV